VSGTVGVVVVNYNGGELTLECLRSLLATDWPADRLRVVLVDNASSDGIVDRVRTELRVVKVIESPVNGGFGAGCNLGIRALAGTDFVALVNNDATVSPGWLRPLVAALDDDPALGAACPKILFAGTFRPIELRADTVVRGRGDARPLGVLVSGAEVDGVDVWRRTQLVDGFWGIEGDGGDTNAQWSGGAAQLRVPAVGTGLETSSLLLSADREVAVTLSSGDRTVEHLVGPSPRFYDVPLGGPALEVINNVGTVLTDDGYGADRGFREPDRGQYEHEEDVFAWCGGAVLLRGQYLEDVGLFDERLFLYYEDLELSWRGAKRGWRYRYVPASVVRHVHAASSVDGSALKRYYDERNHLLVLARHASLARAARAAARSLLVTGSYARRDVVAPVLAGRPVRMRVPKDRLGAFGGFARLLPATIAARRAQPR
jgi:GT2 family glycosyltransferase